VNGRSVRIGIAIGADAITGITPAAGARVVTVPLAGGGDAQAALNAALQQLRAELEAAAGHPLAGASVYSALMPPLSDVRLVPLPPLRPAEAQAVLQRDAGRYFVAVPAPRVVGVRAAKRTGSASLAAAASEQTVQSLRRAIEAVGWRAAHVAPAAAAWLAAAAQSSPHAIIAVVDGTAHVIGVDHGVVSALRRVRAGDHDELAAALRELNGGETGTIVIFAHGAEREAVVRLATSLGWTAAGLHASAAEAAARFGSDAPITFVTSDFAVVQRARESRVALRLALAAVLLFVAAAAVDLWGTQRALQQTRMRRAAIRAQVQPLLAMRDSVDRLQQSVGDLDSIARGVPRWTGALFDLAMLLPAESYVTRLYATGDTIVIDGVGARAGDALQALRGAGALRDVRLLGAVDRELVDGATAAERFRISARLAGVRAPADSAEAAR